jgi:tellurite methyltransferase
MDECHLSYIGDILCQGKMSSPPQAGAYAEPLKGWPLPRIPALGVEIKWNDLQKKAVIKCFRGARKVKNDRRRWDRKYGEKQSPLPDQKPSSLLRKHIGLLPRGKALDLAAGEGRNAVFLAEHGFAAEAVDISAIALSRARKLAGARGVKIKTLAADLDSYPIGRKQYDLILDFFFLDRRLIPGIKGGLKKGGVIVFETYTRDQENLGLSGPSNPDYFLKPNELLHLFLDFHVLIYREGTFREGGRRKAIASLIAKKI